MTQGHIEEVLVCCKNYDEIVNFHFSSYDFVTEKLISVYQDYLFQIDPSDAKMLQMAKQLDQIMYVYITTPNFYQFVQKSYQMDTCLFFEDVSDIIALYHDYIKEEMKYLNQTKWI